MHCNLVWILFSMFVNILRLLQFGYLSKQYCTQSTSDCGSALIVVQFSSTSDMKYIRYNRMPCNGAECEIGFFGRNKARLVIIHHSQLHRFAAAIAGKTFDR